MASLFKPRRDLAGKRAIVTGASSGIGRCLALELARAGARQVLLARSAEKLENVCDEVRAAGGQTEMVVGDVTDPAVRGAALERAATEFGGLDLLVNNAGIGAYGRFVEVSPERLRRIAEVNLFAPAEFIREAAPLLQQGNDPAVVNLGSILGSRGLPYSGEYCATKFALHGLSESIRPELARLGIGLLLVAPGATSTDFKDNVIDDHGDAPWTRHGGQPPEQVARATLRGLRQRRRLIIPNTAGWLMVTANRLAPWVVDRVLDRYG